MCKTVAIFRAMNGYSPGAHRRHRRARRGAGARATTLHSRAYGWQSAGQMFAPTFMRHMYDYGTTPEQVAHGARSPTASTPRTTRRPSTRSASRSRTCSTSRIICKPLHLLDCCVETDNATGHHRHQRRARARPAASRRALIRGVVGRVLQAAHRHALPARADLDASPATTRKDILWPNAGVGPEDVDVTGSYDAFTFTTMLQLEDYGFCKKGEGGAVRQRRHHRAGRQAAQQHQRRPSVRGLHARHEHGDRERAPAAPRRRRLLPDRAGRQAPAHLRLPRGRLPPGEGLRGHRQPRLGQSRAPARPWSCGAAEGRRREPWRIQATYLGMPLQLDDLDVENLAYFKHCAAHNFHLQQCADCGLLRYPPTTACPWCMSPKSDWVPVEGKGAVHSYTEVHHAIQPAFKAHTPYLDPAGRSRHPEGQADASTRRCAWSATSRTPDGKLAPPDMVKQGRHRHARAHGLHRCRARLGDSAMDDRRGRHAARQAMALPAGVGQARVTRGILHG